jgi:hypothetical protein
VCLGQNVWIPGCRLIGLCCCCFLVSLLQLRCIRISLSSLTVTTVCFQSTSVKWVMQVMFPSACSFIVCWFSLSFTTCFGLHGHLEACRILHIFIFICLKDCASLLFWFAAFFSRVHTLHVFHLCFVPVQGNNKNHERKQHMCVCVCVCVCERERERERERGVSLFSPAQLCSRLSHTHTHIQWMLLRKQTVNLRPTWQCCQCIDSVLHISHAFF